MRLLITGSEGMLGADLLKVLGKTHQIIPLTWAEADITDKNSLDKFLKNFPPPKFIIHAAAFTNVDEAEKNPAEALKVNALGTAHLVELALALNIPLLYVSTDYVFDGQNIQPYSEDAPTSPINQYGLSKLKGEEIVKTLPRYFIVRTAWLYGKNGRNFVETMLGATEKQSVIKVVNDQKGAPTYTRDLARAIAQLISTRAWGIYHLTNSGQTTWYEFSLKIFELAQKKVSIIPVTSQEFPRPAKRPAYSVLGNQRWLALGWPALRPWAEALKDFILNDLELK